MAKFKIGDKVIGNLLPNGRGNLYLHGSLTQNKIYCIEKVEGSLVVVTTDDGVSSYWSEDWFKLYEEKETEMALTSTMNAEQIRDEILRIDVRIEEAKKDIENAEKERSSLVVKLRDKGFEIVGVDFASKNIEYLDEVVVGETYMVTNNFGEAEDYFVGKRVIVERIDERAHSLFIYARTECGDYGDWMHYQDLAKI